MVGCKACSLKLIDSLMLPNEFNFPNNETGVAQKRRLFHHDFLFLAGSGSGSGACLPSCLPSCFFFLSSKKESVLSIMISCFLLVPALVPGLGSLLGSSFFAQKRRLFHHDFLILAGSGSGSGVCLPIFSGKGSCSIIIYWFLLIPARVPGLVSLLFSSL